METLKCSKCNNFKTVENFRKETRRKRGYSYYCISCASIISRNSHLKHKEKRNAKTRESKQKVLDFIRKSKEKPCTDCGKTLPYFVMEFYHRKDELKKFNIVNGVGTPFSLIKLQEEMNKCDVVCSNCGRIRAYNDREKV